MWKGMAYLGNEKFSVSRVYIEWKPVEADEVEKKL